MKGHKECTKCGADNGARATTCHECNEPFVIGETTEPMFYPIKGFTITTPAGKCPVPWKGDLYEWLEKVKHTEDDNVFAPSALRYWLRTVVDQETYEQLAEEVV